MRILNLGLLAASLALAACGGEPPTDQEPAADAPFAPPEWETGIGEKPGEPVQDCATADTTVAGDVMLDDANRVKQLDEEGVALIDGDLIIGSVDSLAGLGCLRGVTGDVVITGTESLKELDGLGRLGSIGGSLWITENAQLTSLQGFRALKRVGGDLVVERNVALTSLAGVTDIGRGMRGGIYVRDNDALETIVGFSRLAAFGGDLVIAGNPVLDHVEGFYDGETLTVGYGNIIVEDNAMLGWAELPGLGVDSSANTISIANNPELKDLLMHGDLKLRVTGDVVISNNPALETMNGLDRIYAITGDLVVEANQELDSLVGLQGVQAVTGTVEIVANRSLINVDLLRLEEVYGDLMVARNDSLASLSGLRALDEVHGDFTLFANPELDSCYGDAMTTRLDTGRDDMAGRCITR